MVDTRDATFRKITNRNQTDTNEIATAETKNQTVFILQKKNNIKPNSKKTVLKIPIKYQENTKKFGTNTEYRVGIGIFLVYQIIGYRLASLVGTSERSCNTSNRRR